MTALLGLTGSDWNGAIAQLVERLLCKQDVVGSTPSGSTRPQPRPWKRPEAPVLNAVARLRESSQIASGIARRRSPTGIDIVKEECDRLP